MADQKLSSLQPKKLFTPYASFSPDSLSSFSGHFSRYLSRLLVMNWKWSLNIEHKATGLFWLYPSRAGFSSSIFQTNYIKCNLGFHYFFSILSYHELHCTWNKFTSLFLFHTYSFTVISLVSHPCVCAVCLFLLDFILFYGSYHFCFCWDQFGLQALLLRLVPIICDPSRHQILLTTQQIGTLSMYSLVRSGTAFSLLINYQCINVPDPKYVLNKCFVYKPRKLSHLRQREIPLRAVKFFSLCLFAYLGL